MKEFRVMRNIFYVHSPLPHFKKMVFVCNCSIKVFEVSYRELDLLLVLDYHQSFIALTFSTISVRRHSPDSRGPTPTQENGMADSTLPTPSSSQSAISVVSQARRPRCKDYDGKMS